MNTAGMMSWGAVALFLSVLLIFIGLDLYMLFTLLHPGDERGQLVVWKASAYTLLATSGALNASASTVSTSPPAPSSTRLLRNRLFSSVWLPAP